jgi:hypothetical protein
VMDKAGDNHVRNASPGTQPARGGRQEHSREGFR